MEIIKLLKGVIVIIFGSIFVLGGMAFGMKAQSDNLEAEMRKETVQDIAVVNLDEGILKEENHIYYAKQLMEFPDDYFSTVSLEMARKGIDNGSYAGYVIIPAEFSQNIQSINSSNSAPQRIMLEYAVNPNLREDIAKGAVTDIKDFEIRLNTNVSYLYVQAILEEFHDVQDSSQLIMNNDILDLQNLLKIQPQELMEQLENSDIVRVESEIEDVDLLDKYKSNMELTEKLEESYNSFVETGKEEFMTIKGEEDGVIAGIDGFGILISEIDLTHDENGTLVYADGLAELSDYTDDYKEDFNNEITVIKEKLGWIDPNGGNTGIDPLLSLIEEAAKEVTDKSSMIVLLEEQISSLTDMVLADSTLGDKRDEIVGNLEEIRDGLDEEQNEALILGKRSQKVQELEVAINTIIADVDNISQINVSEVEDIIDTKIAAPIDDRVQSESDRIAVEAGEVITQISDYTLKLMEFDAYEYYDQEIIKNIIYDFGENVFAMEEEINDTHADYREYVAEVYDTADKNTENLKEDIKTAYEGTASNVEGMLTLAQNQRGDINKQNVDMLLGFTTKLPYTRLGNLEYIQAYNFIAQPVGSVDASVTHKVSFFTLDYAGIRNAIIILTVIAGLIGISLLSLKLKEGGASIEDSYE